MYNENSWGEDTPEMQATGYSNKELYEVEDIFLRIAVNDKYLFNIERCQTKESQFNALIAVIEYLAKLDGIETIETQYNKFKEVLNRETVII